MNERAPEHRLTDVNLETRRAVCAVCGPTAISVRSKPGGGLRRQCITKRRAERSKGREEYLRDYLKEWKRNRTPEKRRDEYLRDTYGIRQADVDRVYAEQGGRCRICAEEMPEPNVDHCHATLRLRGLLCRDCNTGLGMFKDDVVRLRAAIDYLTV